MCLHCVGLSEVPSVEGRQRISVQPPKRAGNIQVVEGGGGERPKVIGRNMTRNDGRKIRGTRLWMALKVRRRRLCWMLVCNDSQ